MTLRKIRKELRELSVAFHTNAARARGNGGVNRLQQVAEMIRLRLGPGKLSPAELRDISQRSCTVLERLGPKIQWVQSYVTDDRIYCVYIAPSEQSIREHAERGGFPADRISEIASVIDPTTAETRSAGTAGN